MSSLTLLLYQRAVIRYRRKAKMLIAVPTDALAREQWDVQQYLIYSKSSA